MNLTTDPWIPAVRTDGSTEHFSLLGLFANAHQLRDLVAKPHERIALMRLLLCITQAALDGPDDEEAWQMCREQVQPAVAQYLERWHGSFELFGNGQRFLQVSGLKPGKDDDEGNAVTKLDLALATGNNSTLFDNSAGESRHVRPERAAINLLTFQCFSPGGRIGVARWNGTDTPGKGSSNHAPCIPSSMIHTYVIGADLLETITRNLLTRNLIMSAVSAGWGRPIWEFPVNRISDRDAISNATLTYLGRLIPVSRAIQLSATGSTMILGNALDYPIFPDFLESTATITVRKDELAILPASLGRSPWRQLHAITVKRQADRDGNHGPLALQHDLSGTEIRLWVGALVTDKAKIEDTLEASYHVPTTLFGEFGRAAYEEGVKHAESADSNLSKAIGSYASVLKVEKPAYDAARRHFWTQVEQHIDHLFTIARELTPKEQLPASPWGRVVQEAALQAYERACPRRTARQIQAFALGQRYLFAQNKSTDVSSKNSKTNKQTE